MYSRIISIKNKFLDYFNFDKNRNIRNYLTSTYKKKNNQFFDYGVGYFYQSSNKLGIRGLRDSLYRKKIIDIDNLTKGKKILDIGTNSGFLLLELENNFDYALGIDYNPQLIEIANKSKEYLEIKNIDFKVQNFEKDTIKEKFDIILSLANHHTYDKGISSTDLYFEKILSIISDDGFLIFESHHPIIENDEKFHYIIDKYKNKFQIIKKKKYKINNFFDNGRNLVIMKKN
ncbi:class I SAM-dependent methyltransferase [Candidatus Pelagibacter sp.]|nr:class I SAM-dependent methyltransferase [Candidatus Pelagibacter sp.]